MTQLRIDIAALPPEIRRAIADGTEVLVESEGTVVARLEAGSAGEARPSPLRPGGLRAFIELRRNSPALDDDWERDLEEIARYTNQPVEVSSWE